MTARRELLEFLADEKEIYELFMVVDEELKQMCEICHEGGLVLGPYLKPMSHLVHTEYVLSGRTREDIRQVLRDTMFAATVTGSPVENACRLIAQYEPEGRGYYASVAALIGHDVDGVAMADAPILIRTADVDLAGNLVVTAGATLVRDSDPDYETQETWAKASGILSAFGLVDRRAGSPPATPTPSPVTRMFWPRWARGMSGSASSGSPINRELPRCRASSENASSFWTARMTSSR